MLPSGPDPVHRPLLHGTRLSTPPRMTAVQNDRISERLRPCWAGCRFVRVPPAPHLARPLHLSAPRLHARRSTSVWILADPAQGVKLASRMPRAEPRRCLTPFTRPNYNCRSGMGNPASTVSGGAPMDSQYPPAQPANAPPPGAPAQPPQPLPPTAVPRRRRSPGSGCLFWIVGGLAVLFFGCTVLLLIGFVGLLISRGGTGVSADGAARRRNWSSRRSKGTARTRFSSCRSAA